MRTVSRDFGNGLFGFLKKIISGKIQRGTIASHTGKTALAPVSDEKELTNYLWPIVCEMIKTAIENEQNFIVEGCTSQKLSQYGILFLECVVYFKVHQ